ncbi:MAG: hypothetical protein ACRYFY_01825 [Janthinobacterium lividum]
MFAIRLQAVARETTDLVAARLRNHADPDRRRIEMLAGRALIFTHSTI